ncbi:MAG TPA: outer membrane beta-barrel protein [Candidatus Binatia bacterium]
MKGFLVGFAWLMGVTLTGFAALGADSSPAYNWTGFYLGVNGGGGWGHSRHDFEAAGTTTGDYRIRGATVGGTLGANLQAGGLLLGLEGDMNWSDIGGSDSCPNVNFTCRTRNKWLATARGRVGYALDRFLPYITTGAAFGDVHTEIPDFGSSREAEVGWTVGGGLEAGIVRGLSAKMEYLYVDLGKFNCGFSCTATGVDDVKFNAHIVRIGLNYRF